MKNKLWVDDILEPINESWEWAKSYNEAMELLSNNKFSSIALDHDLGLDKTGYDIACWIEEQVALGKIRAPLMYCISANPVGKRKIEQVIKNVHAIRNTEK